MQELHVPVQDVTCNKAWNGRQGIENDLMELAVDITARGQEKAGEAVSVERLRALASDDIRIEAMLSGIPPEKKWFVLAGHRRFLACELAAQRFSTFDGLYLLRDVSVRVKSLEDMREINIRENAWQKPLTPAETASRVLEMRDVEGIPAEKIAAFFGKDKAKGVKWVKDMVALGKNLHQSVFAALEAGTIQVSTALEYSRMPPEEQARVIQKGLTKVVEVKAERAETAGRTPRPSASAGYKSAKDQIAGMRAVMERNKDVLKRSAAGQMMSAFCERLQGGLSMKQFIAKLDAIHENGQLDTGLLDSDTEERAEAAGN